MLQHDLPPLLNAKASALLRYVGSWCKVNKWSYAELRERYGINKADADKIINTLVADGVLSVANTDGGIILKRVTQ